MIGRVSSPATVAAVASLAHLKDKFSWGVLPAGCWKDVISAAAAQVACAVSGAYGRMGGFMDALAPCAEPEDNRSFLELACRALALGFQEKWNEWFSR